ncbi:MAG: alpha/beta hydrolase [Myxococcales bacterium]|nr:alpha/beta hydrolase [Myxococcales bacterium]
MTAFVLITVACSPFRPAETLLLPDPAREGTAGQLGPFGVEVRELAVQARVTEVVDADVVYPVQDGSHARDAPVVVFLHGGFVPPVRYRWLAVHLASRGLVTLMPRAELDLALLQAGNGALALDALRDAAQADEPLLDLVASDGPAAVMGHSLGGVTAARQWVGDDSLDLLVMLAAFPADADPVEDQGDRPVLAVSGTTDESLLPDDFVTRSQRYSTASIWLVEGLNHYGWTDDATSGELGRDGPLEGELGDLRTRALALLDAHLDVALADADPTLLDGPFEGLTEVTP